MEERLTREEILDAMKAIEEANDQVAYEASLLAQVILTVEEGQEAGKAESDGD
jgi:hypothetical protein